MANRQIAHIAAEYAKEIVVAKMTNSGMSANSETGKNVADFYASIFNGLCNALEESNLFD